MADLVRVIPARTRGNLNPFLAKEGFLLIGRNFKSIYNYNTKFYSLVTRLPVCCQSSGMSKRCCKRVWVAFESPYLYGLDRKTSGQVDIIKRIRLVGLGWCECLVAFSRVQEGEGKEKERPKTP